MGIFVVIKDIGNAKSTDRKDEPVSGLSFSKLIEAGVHFPRLAAEVDRLADEIALHASVGVVRAELVSFATRVTGDTERLGDPQILDRFPD